MFQVLVKGGQMLYHQIINRINQVDLSEIWICIRKQLLNMWALSVKKFGCMSSLEKNIGYVTSIQRNMNMWNLKWLKLDMWAHYRQILKLTYNLLMNKGESSVGKQR